ncbi:MAG: hypothetical protein LBL48_00700 [Azoarcus sp.]|nr:hypothetical protein [Azoarcus sp.]
MLDFQRNEFSLQSVRAALIPQFRFRAAVEETRCAYGAISAGNSPRFVARIEKRKTQMSGKRQHEEKKRPFEYGWNGDQALGEIVTNSVSVAIP